MGRVAAPRGGVRARDVRVGEVDDGASSSPRRARCRPQPIPPSADWRIDLARGCPAHCQYCYLAGSLTGPPVTRVYANLDEVLAPIATSPGRAR